MGLAVSSPCSRNPQRLKIKDKLYKVVLDFLSVGLAKRSLG